MGGYKWILSLSMIATIFTATMLIVEAKRIVLRPLTGKEVYQVLKAAGRENVLPEGRQFTQGIAALAGYTVGVASGIGGAIAYDLITQPNQTMTWINGLFGGNTTTTPPPPQSFVQEICFESRSLKHKPEGRQTIDTENTPTSGATASSPTYDTDELSPTATSTAATTPTSASEGEGDGDEPTCITIEKPKPTQRRRRTFVG